MTDYDIRQVERFEEPRFTEMLNEGILGPSGHLPSEVLHDLSPEARRELQKRRGMLRIGAYAGDTLVAFTVGWQEFDDQFYMAASVVDPAHRRRGLYSRLMAEVVEHCRAVGYTQIWSNHVATNNAILIAKLRAGFMITGLGMMAEHGLMVRLSLPLSEGVAQALRMRSGQTRVPQSFMPYLVEGA